MLDHEPMEGGAADLQLLGSTADVAAMLGERLDQRLALGVMTGVAQGGLTLRRRHLEAQVGR